MSEQADQWRKSVARLSTGERAVVENCLRAAITGPYLDDDDEFHTLMGVTRVEAAEVLDSWPEWAPNGLGVITVNNALNNLLGYPHGQWRQLSREIDATERDVTQALLSWRGDDHRAAGGRGYFDSLK